MNIPHLTSASLQEGQEPGQLRVARGTGTGGRCLPLLLSYCSSYWALPVAVGLKSQFIDLFILKERSRKFIFTSDLDWMSLMMFNRLKVQQFIYNTIK